MAITKRLRSAEFSRFLSGEVPGYFAVAVATEEIASILEAKSRVVLLSQATILSHMGVHSEVTQERYQFLQTLLDHGELIQDRDRHVIVYAHDGEWWVAVLKRTSKGEIFLQSYHRSNPDHLRRIKKRLEAPFSVERRARRPGSETPQRPRRLPGIAFTPTCRPTF
jgi:hypothetical protein